MECEQCGKRPCKGIVPSKGDFPEPIRVCPECAQAYPFVDRDGFPVTHFKSENGHWYFVYIHRDYLTPYFYPSSRPDYKYLDKDRALSGEVMRSRDLPMCNRVLPYVYSPSTEEQILYFAYGSALDERQLTRKDIHFTIIGAATLFEARLDFSKPSGSHGIANLRVGEKDDYVMGLLYRLEREKDLKKMDRWKDVAGDKSQSRRILVHLHENGQPVPALTHIYPDFKSGLYPSRSYLGKLLTALKRHGFPGQWLELMEAVKSNGDSISGDVRSLAVYEAGA